MYRLNLQDNFQNLRLLSFSPISPLQTNGPDKHKLEKYYSIKNKPYIIEKKITLKNSTYYLYTLFFKAYQCKIGNFQGCILSCKFEMTAYIISVTMPLEIPLFRQSQLYFIHVSISIRLNINILRKFFLRSSGSLQDPSII